MNNKFDKLTRKMFFRIVLSALLVGIGFTLLVFFVVEGVFQDSAANYMDRIGIYRFMQSNKSDILFFAFFAILLVAFYFVIRKTASYFNKISDAVEQVFSENEETIALPEELEPIEMQLNAIKHTLKIRQYQARESEQRKNDLVVYLAHDLKTPLTSVIGYLNLLHDEPEISPELQQKYLSITKDKAERLEALINEFFEITRFNLQNIELDQQKINLTVMLRQLVDEFYPLFAPKGLTCLAQIIPDLYYRGDADKLARVFDNLLRNAINYSYPSSVISIMTQQNEKGITLSFQNQGDVIPEHKLSSVFEKFYRLDSARHSQTGGAGLGLAIAKEIVKQHGGTIEASSDSNQTCFSIFLPV